MKWHFASELSPPLSAWQRLSARQPCLQTCAWYAPPLYLTQPTNDQRLSLRTSCALQANSIRRRPSMFRVRWQSITRRGLITDTTELLSTSLLPQPLSNHRSYLSPATRLHHCSRRHSLFSQPLLILTSPRRRPNAEARMPQRCVADAALRVSPPQRLKRRRPNDETTTPQR